MDSFQSCIKIYTHAFSDPVKQFLKNIVLTSEASSLQTSISKLLMDIFELEEVLVSPTDYRKCTALLDVVWEKLNTGHWKNVDVVWRKLYSVVILSQLFVLSGLFFRSPEAVTEKDLAIDFIRLCDKGMLMGYPVCDGICGKIATSLSKIYSGSDDVSPAKKRPRLETAAKNSLLNSDPNVRPVPVKDELSMEEFIEKFKSTKEPVVVRGMMEWPAMTKWNVQYLRKVAGFRTVPVEIGRRYTDDAWTQTLMTINDYVDRFLGPDSSEIGYLAQHELLDQIAELREDIDIPEYCFTGDDEDVVINSWFGPAGTVSPLHTDPKHNFLCQVFGEKYVRLYPASQTEFLYPYEGTLLSNTSKVDLENRDANQFPDFEKAKGLECTLKEGEMLYIPPGCWHFVRSMSTSFSLSFWFE